MNELIFLIEEADEGGYTARALGESIFTEADTLPALRAMVRDAVQCHFEDTQQPKVVRLHFVREEVFAVCNCRALCQDRFGKGAGMFGLHRDAPDRQPYAADYATSWRAPFDRSVPRSGEGWDFTRDAV